MLTQEQAAAELWGDEHARAEKWRKFPTAQRSAVLNAIAQLHIRGSVSYRTALLTAIDALSVRAVQMGKPERAADDRRIRAALMRGDVSVLEEMVAMLAAFDEQTTDEFMEETRRRAFILSMKDIKMHIPDVS